MESYQPRRPALSLRLGVQEAGARDGGDSEVPCECQGRRDKAV
jgi:hypothetical protein